jgi:acetyl esterase/lipase
MPLRRPTALAALTVLACSIAVFAAPPAPTHADVAYGSDPNQVLDFYAAPGDRPAPLVFFMHGGGWVRGSKRPVGHVEKWLAAGLSVVSIEYRMVTQAQAAAISPPVKWPMEDVARALQFVRSKAAEWKIDPARVGVCGGSAGACSTLWLAFHDDLADPQSADPVARQSTRVTCAAVIVPQTSLDPQQMKEWIPNIGYGAHAFGVSGFTNFLAQRERLLPWIKAYSPYAWVSADDPPVYMEFREPPALGKAQKDATHSANFGVKLQERLREVGVPCELVHPGVTNPTHATVADFLIATLRSPPAP